MTLEETKKSLDAVREGLDEIGEMCQQLDESAGKLHLWMTIRTIENIVATDQALREETE